MTTRLLRASLCKDTRCLSGGFLRGVFFVFVCVFLASVSIPAGDSS